MRNQMTRTLVFTLFITMFSPVTVEAIPTSRLKYTIDEQNETEPVQFEVNMSHVGVRYDFRQGERFHSLLYRDDSSPALYTLNHNDVRGLKITLSGIDHYVTLANKNRERVKNRLNGLPEKRRNAIEQRMNLGEINDQKTLDRPRFQPTGDTIWHGLWGRAGDFHTADGTVGRSILSHNPLVELTESESIVLTNFSEFLYRWISISSQISEAEMNSPRNLIAEEYTRLIRYRNSDVVMELADWDRLDRPDNFFRVPPSYQVESLRQVGETNPEVSK